MILLDTSVLSRPFRRSRPGPAERRVADHVQAARLRNRCLAKGLNVSGIDCLIAAIAVAGEHELFAVDGDFRSLARHAPLRLFDEGSGISSSESRR